MKRRYDRSPFSAWYSAGCFVALCAATAVWTIFIMILLWWLK